MPNNQLINKPKLNIFQKIRKALLMRRVNKDTYDKAPEYLKTDSDVIQRLMENAPWNINHLSENIAIEYIQHHPEIIEKADKTLLHKVLEHRPELFINLSENQQTNLIFTEKEFKFIKYLSKEQQLEFLTKLTGRLQILPKFFADKLEYFDEDVLFRAINIHKNILSEEKAWYSSNEEKRKLYNISDDFYLKMKLTNLKIDTQIKLALLDDRLIKKLSREATIKFVNNNPLLLDLLPDDVREDLINSNPELLIMLNNSDRLERVSKNQKLERFIPYQSKGFRTNQYKVDYNEVMKISTLGYDHYYDLSHITDSINNPEELWEVAKTIPQALSITGITNHFESGKKLEYVKELFKNNIGDKKIIQAINQSMYFFGYKEYTYNEMILNSSICKVLTDEKVLANANSDKIVEFIENPSMDLMKELIIETYGENAKKVLDSRPGLTMENIPNLRIFDQKIFENFGESTVHNQLSYDTKFSILLADFANHPEKIDQYKKFEKLTDGLFEKNSAGNEAKYKAFMELSDLIFKLDEKDMTPERIESLKLIIADSKSPETRTLPLEKIEDLDNYNSARNKIYDDAIQKLTDITKIKDILSKRFFGMQYKKQLDERYTSSSLTLNGMIYYYSIDNLLSDKRTEESDLFNEDEIDAIKLASIIDKINDPNVLKEVYKVLSDKQNIIGPVEFESIKQKIPVQYSRELVSQLLTPEEAIKRAENGEDGISVEHGEDEVDIIKLQGADFKIMMHSMFGLDGFESNSGINIPKGTSPEELWKNFEKGCSTISNCLIEPGMLKSCGSDLDVINIGIANIDPRLVIGMSHHDAHVSHTRRDPDPYFDYYGAKLNYPEELMRKTAAQITGQEERDISHDYNEVTTYRFEQDPDKITSETSGGRIMPDYIVVYGKSNEVHRELSKAFSKNGKPIPIIEIDMEAYKDNSIYTRAMKRDEEHQAEPKEDSELINTVKKAANLDQSEER